MSRTATVTDSNNNNNPSAQISRDPGPLVSYPGAYGYKYSTLYIRSTNGDPETGESPEIRQARPGPLISAQVGGLG